MIYLDNILDIQDIYIPRQVVNTDAEPQTIPELSAYTPTSGFSTINGNVITNGGNIEIEARNVEYVSELINDAGYITQSALTGYATESFVTGTTSISMAIETARTESVYAKKTDIPDIDDINERLDTVENDIADLQSDKVDSSTFAAYTAYTVDSIADLQSGKADNNTFTAFTAYTEECIADIEGVVSNLANEVDNLQPYIVYYYDWYWDGEKWVWDNYSEFDSIDAVYDYIRTCKHYGCPLYQFDEDYYGYAVTNEIDGKKYYFCSPEPKYESFLDPNRPTKTKAKDIPFHGKYIVRKHIPVGWLDGENTRNPAVGANYFFQGANFYFKLRLLEGESAYFIKREGFGIRMPESGYGNMYFDEGDWQYIPKPYEVEDTENYFIITNTRYQGFNYTIEVTQPYGENFLVEVMDRICYYENGQLYIDINRLKFNPHYTDGPTTSLGFVIEQGRLKCYKPTRLPEPYLGLLNGNTSALIKEADGTIVWKYYKETDANHMMGDWLFRRDKRFVEVQRRHRKFIYNREIREQNYGKDTIRASFIDSTLVIWRKNVEEFDDYSQITVSIYNKLKPDQHDSYTFNGIFNQTVDDMIYTHHRPGWEVLDVDVSYEDGTDEGDMHFTSVPYQRRKLCEFSKVGKGRSEHNDRIIKSYWDNETINIHSRAIVFKVFNKYKCIKSQIPLTVVLKLSSPSSRV